LYSPLNSLRTTLTYWYTIRKWQRDGCPLPPPPQVKHATIKEYGKRFRLDVLVETGTYLGDTIAATKKHFAEIYSIELSRDLHERAKQRFVGESKVHLLLGDSGDILKAILSATTRIPLFWLDAHYSAGCTARGVLDTPILKELETIFALCPDSVVLIDDARCFDGTNSYPTLAELRKQVAERAPHWVFHVKHDIIRLHGQFEQKRKGQCTSQTPAALGPSNFPAIR
jgi:hypothetical protein